MLTPACKSLFLKKSLTAVRLKPYVSDETVLVQVQNVLFLMHTCCVCKRNVLRVSLSSVHFSKTGHCFEVMFISLFIFRLSYCFHTHIVITQFVDGQ
jgi:hypothetical protein